MAGWALFEQRLARVFYLTRDKFPWTTLTPNVPHCYNPVERASPSRKATDTIFTWRFYDVHHHFLREVLVIEIATIRSTMLHVYGDTIGPRQPYESFFHRLL